MKKKSGNAEISKLKKSPKAKKIPEPENNYLRRKPEFGNRQLTFNENTVLMALILVILTLLIITFAMFKLAGSIASLSERLYILEDILIKNAKECVNK